MQIHGRDERSKAIARRRGRLRRRRDARHRRSTDACTRTRPTMRLHRRVFQAPLLEPNGRTDGRTIVPAHLRRRGSVWNTSPWPRTRVSKTQHAATTPTPVRHDGSIRPGSVPSTRTIRLSLLLRARARCFHSLRLATPLRFTTVHNRRAISASLRFTTVHNQRVGDGRRQGVHLRRRVCLLASG